MNSARLPTARLLTTVLLAGLLLSACAAAPPRKENITQALACVPKDAVARCISGEELRHFGLYGTADALRYAMFPWIF